MNTAPPMSTPHVVVVMGVAGTGKTTIGPLLAAELGVPYAEGDDFHPPANIAKMSAGAPLDDDDRWPWLDAIGEWAHGRAGLGGVVSSSALKRAYRDRLREGAPDAVFLHLTGDRELIEERMADRKGHFMPTALLDSQFATLQPLRADEAGVSVDVVRHPYGNHPASRRGTAPARQLRTFTVTSLSVEMLAADAAEPITSAGNAQLGIAVLAGIAVIVLLITKLKMHAFLALTIGSLALGSFAGAAPADTIASFTAGLGSTVAGVGVLIALGAILGKLLADSGGADQVVDTILAKASGRAMPWAMVLIASIIGLPLFFEVGIVLMIPVVLLVAKRGNYSLMRIGIPALAGLSVMHGLIPPHPGPLVAIDALDANLGVTLALGVLVAVPTVIIAGPVFSRYAARWVDIKPPENMIPQRPSEELDRRPSFGATLATILLPVFLMLLNALVEIVVDVPANGLQKVTMASVRALLRADVEQRLADDAHHAEDRGHHPGDHHQGGAGRDHRQQKPGGAEPAGPQGAFLALVGVDPTGAGSPPGGVGLAGE
ncbi:hypothetical protein SCALM49S_07155 [Streptomyces californicus]